MKKLYANTFILLDFRQINLLIFPLLDAFTTYSILMQKKIDDYAIMLLRCQNEYEKY